MKKILLVLGALAILSTAAYSFKGYGYGSGCLFGGPGGMGRNSGYHMGSGRMGGNTGYHMGSGGYNNFTPEQQQEYLDMREKNTVIYEKYSVDIRQKRLDVERELLNEKPDWKKVEKLNEEIAKLESKAKTEIMKNSY